MIAGRCCQSNGWRVVLQLLVAKKRAAFLVRLSCGWPVCPLARASLPPAPLSLTNEGTQRLFPPKLVSTALAPLRVELTPARRFRARAGARDDDHHRARTPDDAPCYRYSCMNADFFIQAH